jgi:hypothetical protein
MIGNSINELISIAERQSDERLAQELNPQTETGMLGPTWLPASELAFRQKIRAEAQAQPQNNPPVVQQLAQASAPPMMPQQMPQQMPPQMMAEGGLVGYANGGYVDVGQRLGPLMSPDDLLRRNFPQYFSVSPDQQIVDDAIDQLMDNQPNIARQAADQANLNAQLAMGERNLLRNREDEMLENRLTNMERQSEQYNQSSRPTIIGKDQVSGISGLNPDDIRNAGNLDIDDQGNIINKSEQNFNERLLSMATDAPYDENTSPFGRDVREFFRRIEGYGTTEETEKEILARQIEKEQGKNLNLIQTEGGVTGYLKKGVSDEELARMTQAEKFYEGLMDEGRPTGISPRKTIGELDSKTISRYFANNPDEYAQLQAYQKEFGEKEGLLRFAEQGGYKPIEEIEVTANERQALEKIQQDASNDPNSTKQQVAVTGDGTPIVSKETTINQSGGNKGVTDDAFLAEEQRLSKAKEEIFKGNMDRKWMAIAAGAFNAAQRGAPTLMQGLADLGGDVTKELQKLDKEDQDRAIALHEIYLQEATLAEAKRKTDLTYASDMADVMSKLNQAGIDNKMDQLKYLLESGTDYADIAKSISQGMIDNDYQFTADILHSKIGNPSARIGYNQHLSKLKNKEAEIISKIQEEIGEDYNPENSEHRERAMVLYDEFLSDNPGLREIRSDYWSGTNQSDWVTGTLIL